MALLIKQGVLDTPASNGTQVIDGIGFQPKALIFYNARKDGESTDNIMSHSLGFATSPTDQMVNSSAMALSSATGSQYAYTDSCVHVIGGAGIAQASLTSIDADGFTLNWTSTSSAMTGMDVHYQAIGGDDVLNAKAVSETNETTSTGQTAYTGYGFQPNTLIFSASRTANTSTDAWGGVGAAAGVGSTIDGQWATTWGLNHINNGTSSRQRSDRCFIMNNEAGTVYGEARILQFTSDGYDLYWHDAPLSNVSVHVLALELLAPAKVGTVAQSASTGSQVVSGLGALPKGAFFSTHGRTSSISNRFEVELSHTWTDDTTKVGTSVGRPNLKIPWGRQSYTTPLVIADTPSSSAPYSTVRASGDVAFDSDGYTFNWATNDGTSRDITYVIFGEVDLPETHDGEFALTASGTLTTLNEALRDASLDIAALADVTALADRVRDTSAAYSGEATLDTYVNVVRTTSVAYIGTADVYSRGTILMDADFALTVSSDASIAVARLRDTNFDMNSVLTIASQSGVAYATSLVVDTSAGMNIVAGIVADIDMAYEANSGVLITNDRVRDTDSHLLTETSMIATSQKQVSGVIHESGVLLLTSTTQGIKAGAYTLNSSADIDIEAHPFFLYTYETAYGRAIDARHTATVRGLPQAVVYRRKE